ncbi:hypothetical protein [Microscilla marina]|uniref:Uncharacterized protein n=1 Tax=Microscilla marina ATCC 23134 TaxID=313606 RepID=A1ZQ78_MICM2|nr:hypothetical protein [Microscilla marina]EAY27487.1 hypothetical protein M23134_06888 [Microscilla marina ATCC 23134]
MKNTLYLLLLAGLLFSSGATAQSDQKQIKETLTSYFTLLEKNEMIKSLDYLYPRFFEIVPRKQIEKSMNGVRNRGISFQSPLLTSLSDVIQVNQAKYALAAYTFKLLVKKKGKSEVALQDLASFFKQVYGNNNVSLDHANQQLVIQTKGEMYVINDPAYQGWKVLEKKKEEHKVLNKLLPKEVLEKL